MEKELAEAQQQQQQQPAAAAGSHEVRLNFPYQLRRVPWWVRDVDEQAYAPKFICIGPYHSGGKSSNSLRREGLQQRYANELLRDATERDDEACRAAQSCCQSLRRMINRIREFYAEDKGTETEELVNMMFLDGCFIIKHLYNYALGSDEKELFQSRWAPAQLRSDLTLLENQIPFDVLVALFQHVAPRTLRLDGADEKKKRCKLLDMALWYMLKGSFPSPTVVLSIDPEVPFDHLLHLLHVAHCKQLHHLAQQRPSPALEKALPSRACALPARLRLMKVLRCMCMCSWELGPDEEPDIKENIPSAAELKNALGIRIIMAEAGQDPVGVSSLLDVRFMEDRLTLEIPRLYVEQTTAPLLQNLVAYEQQVGTGGEKYPDDYFTTYAFLMYNLISTREDINLLEEQRVLHNNFGDDVKIISYFKNLCVWNRRSGSTTLDKVLQGLRRCKQQKVYRDWAEVKNYINSPVKLFLIIISAMVSLSTVLQALIALRPIEH